MCESVYAFTGEPLNRISFLSILFYVTVTGFGAGNVIDRMRVGLFRTIKQAIFHSTQFLKILCWALIDPCNRCACLAMQNVPPALLIRFLREHRSEWADHDIDANAATAFRNTSNGQISRGGMSHMQLPLPLAHSGEQGEVSLLS